MNRKLLLHFLCILFLLLHGYAVRAQTANFSFSPVSGCAPLVVNFTDLSTGGITSYYWDLGNSVTSTQQHPSTTYLTPGNYNVTLTVTGPAGTDQKTATVIVYDKPVVSFVATGPLTGCTPHNVQFTSTVIPNAPGNLTYSWDFGDGTTGTGANPAHTYATAGTYSVLLTVTSGQGCVQTAVQNSYIIARPVAKAQFTASQIYFCGTPANVSFSNVSSGGSSPYTASWDFGDGGTALGNTTAHAYVNGGTFTVTLISTDRYGCADTFINPNLITVVGQQPTFAAPAAVCEIAKANFTNTSMGYSSTSWDFGDGTFDKTSNSVDHYYQQAGTYTVTMTTVIGGCTKTVSKPIQVDPKPRATITMNPPIPCPPPVTVSFSATSSVPNISGYDWSWGSGGTASGSTVSKFYPLKNANTDYLNYYTDNVQIITTSGAGCKDTTNMDTVYIRNMLLGALPGNPVCNPVGGPVSGCFPFEVLFGTELKSMLPPPPPGACNPPNYPYQPVTWLWDFGDGSPKSTQATPTHIYPVYGNYYVKVNITTANGCIDSSFTTVHTDSNTKPSFFATPLDACQNSPIYYKNTTANILPGTIFTWGIQDVHVGKIDSTMYSPDSINAISMARYPGVYTAFLTSNHGGCPDTTYIRNYITIHPPDARFIDSPFCSPNTKTVKFINLTDSGTSFYWKFGDGAISTAQHPVHTYAAPGSYMVTMVAHNSLYNCFDTATLRIQIKIPSFDFAATDSSICPYQWVRFNAAHSGFNRPWFAFSTDTMISGYDTLGTAVFRYAHRGYEDVTMYVRDGDCTDTMIKPGFMLVSQPGLKYSTTPEIGCMPLNVTFQDSSDNVPGIRNVSWKWAFGDGDTSITLQKPITHFYDSVGTFIVYMIVTDSMGCESDLAIGYDTVSVFKPKASYIISDTSVCAFEPVKFTDYSTVASALQHHWSFGDGTTDTGVAPRHVYPLRGKYATRLIVTDAVGCSDTLASDSIRVDAPTAAYTQSDTLGLCPPLLVRFSNQSTFANSYVWDFGEGGSPIPVTSPVYTYRNPGIFNISLIAVDANGCTDTATSLMRMLGYNGAFTYTPVTGCAPLSVAFSTPLTGIAQITWDYGDGVTSTGSSTTATHTYQNTGPYMPKVIFSDGASCVSPSLGLDTIHVDRVNANFGWTVPCAGTPFTLNDSSTSVYAAPDTRFWIFGAADTAVGAPVTHIYMTPGNHQVTLIAVNATGCKDTITRNVFVNDLPKIDVTKDTAICPGDPVRLFVFGALSYIWSPAPDSMLNCPTCDIAFVHLSSTTPGSSAYFRVSGTDANGCVNSDSTKVTIQIKTTSSTGDGGEICVGESFRLHAGGAQKYEWMPKESLDSPYSADPLATPQRTTTYVVAAQEGSCLIDSQSVQVIVHSRPIFSAGNDEVIALGAALTLKPTTSGISRIEWRPDTTLTSLTSFNPTAHPYYTRTYYATAYDEFGCSATDSVTVFVRCNGSLVFIPNTFTPNGDGNNDYFFPRGEGLGRMNVFRVFNRWGEVVFERSDVALNDERAGWDGRFLGKELPPDVYVYHMQSTCATGEVLHWKGDVTLIR